MARITLDSILQETSLSPTEDADNVRITGEARDRRVVEVDAYEARHEGGYNQQSVHPMAETALITMNDILSQEGTEVELLDGDFGHGRQGAKIHPADDSNYAQGMIDSGMGSPMTSSTQEQRDSELDGMVARNLGGAPTEGYEFASTMRKIAEDGIIRWNPAENGRMTFEGQPRQTKGSVLGKSWSRGVDNLKVSGGGLMSYLGEKMGDDELRAAGDAYASDANLDARLNPATIADFSHAMTSVPNFVDYVTEAVGENLPAMIPDILAGLVTGGFGTAAVATARTGLMKAAINKYGVDKVKAQVMKYAAGTGAGLSMGAQGTGTFADEMTVEGKTDRGLVPLAVGAGTAVANLVPEIMLFGKAAKAAGLTDAAVKRVTERAKDVLETMAIGGAGEAFATPVSMAIEDTARITNDMKTMDEVHYEDYIEGTIRGIIGGAGVGGTMSVVANTAGAVSQQYRSAQEQAVEEQGHTTDQFYNPEFTTKQGVYDEREGSYVPENAAMRAPRAQVQAVQGAEKTYNDGGSIANIEGGEAVVNTFKGTYDPSTAPEFMVNQSPEAVAATVTAEKHKMSAELEQLIAENEQARTTDTALDAPVQNEPTHQAWQKELDAGGAKQASVTHQATSLDSITKEPVMKDPSHLPTKDELEIVAEADRQNTRTREINEAKAKKEQDKKDVAKKVAEGKKHRKAREIAPKLKADFEADTAPKKQPRLQRQQKQAVDKTSVAETKKLQDSQKQSEARSVANSPLKDERVAGISKAQQFREDQKTQNAARVTKEKAAHARKVAAAKVEARKSMSAQEIRAELRAEKRVAMLSKLAKSKERMLAHDPLKGQYIDKEAVGGTRTLPGRRQQKHRANPEWDFTEKSVSGELTSTRKTELSRLLITRDDTVARTKDVAGLIKQGKLTSAEVGLYAQSLGIDLTTSAQGRNRTVDWDSKENEANLETLEGRIANFANKTPWFKKALLDIEADKSTTRGEKAVLAYEMEGAFIKRVDLMPTMHAATVLNRIREHLLSNKEAVPEYVQNQEFLEQQQHQLFAEAMGGDVSTIEHRNISLGMINNIRDSFKGNKSHLAKLNNMIDQASKGVISTSQLMTMLKTLDDRIRMKNDLKAGASNVGAVARLRALFQPKKITKEAREAMTADDIAAEAELAKFLQQLDAIVEADKSKSLSPTQMERVLRSLEDRYNKEDVDDTADMEVSVAEIATDAQREEGAVANTVLNVVEGEVHLAENMGMGYLTKLERTETVTMEMTRAMGTFVFLMNNASLRVRTADTIIDAMGYDNGTQALASMLYPDINPDQTAMKQVWENPAYAKQKTAIERRIRKDGGEVTPELLGMLRSMEVSGDTVTAGSKSVPLVKMGHSVTTLLPNDSTTSIVIQSLQRIKPRKGDYAQGTVMATAVDGTEVKISAHRLLDRQLTIAGLDTDSVLTQDVYLHYVDGVEHLRQTAMINNLPVKFDGIYNDSTVIYVNPLNRGDVMTLGDARRAYEARSQRKAFSEKQKKSTAVADIKAIVSKLVRGAMETDEYGNVREGYRDVNDVSLAALRGIDDMFKAGMDFADMKAFDKAVSEYLDGVNLVQEWIDQATTAMAEAKAEESTVKHTAENRVHDKDAKKEEGLAKTEDKILRDARKKTKQAVKAYATASSVADNKDIYQAYEGAQTKERVLVQLEQFFTPRADQISDTRDSQYGRETIDNTFVERPVSTTNLILETKNIVVTNQTAVELIGADGTAQGKVLAGQFQVKLGKLEEAQKTGNEFLIDHASEEFFNASIKASSYYVNTGLAKKSADMRRGVDGVMKRRFTKLNKNIATDIASTIIGRVTVVAPKLAKVLHVSSGGGYLRNVENRRRAFYSSISDLLGDAKRMNVAMGVLTDGGEATADSKELTRFMKRFNQYVNKHNPHANLTDTPVILNTEQLLERKAEVLAILRLGGSTDVEAEFSELLGSRGSREFTLDISPHALPGARRGAQSVVGHPLITKALRDGGFLKSDSQTVLVQYIASGIRNAEWHRLMSSTDAKGVFHENSKYREMTSHLDAGSRESTELRKVMQGMMGQLHQDIPRGWRMFNSVAIGFNNLRLLAFSGLSSIPEAGLVLARTHSIKFAAANLGGFAKKMLTTKGRAEIRQLTTELGMMEHIVVKQNLTELWGSGELSVNAAMQRGTDWMFRLNGQYAVTNFTRKMSAFMGKNFIYDHAVKAAKGDAMSKSYLESLNITAEEVEAYRVYENENGATGYNVFDTDIGKITTPMADAINLFSQQSVLTPNAAQLPLYATDARFATVGHFKTFFYAMYDAFYKGILAGEFSRNKKNASVMKAIMAMGPTVVFSALIMVGLGAFQDILRNGVKGNGFTMTGEEDEWLMKAFTQSGLMGPATIIDSAFQSAGWGRSGTAAALGPTADYMLNELMGDNTGKHIFMNSVPLISQNVGGSKQYAGKAYDKFLSSDSYE